MSTQQLTQIRISTRSREYGPAVGQSIDSEAYSRAEADFHGKLLRLCPESLWYHGSYASGCPRPILVSEHHQQQMQDLHKALTIAIIDIVTRWWSDDEARFPERMPLDAEEEELLKVRRRSSPRLGTSRSASCCVAVDRRASLSWEHLRVPQMSRILAPRLPRRGGRAPG